MIDIYILFIKKNNINIINHFFLYLNTTFKVLMTAVTLK